MSISFNPAIATVANSPVTPFGKILSGDSITSFPPRKSPMIAFNTQQVTSQAICQALPVATLPSFKDVHFTVIGKKPDLLQRMSSPELTARSIALSPATPSSPGVNISLFESSPCNHNLQSVKGDGPVKVALPSASGLQISKAESPPEESFNSSHPAQSPLTRTNTSSQAEFVPSTFNMLSPLTVACITSDLPSTPNSTYMDVDSSNVPRHPQPSTKFSGNSVFPSQAPVHCVPDVLAGSHSELILPPLPSFTVPSMPTFSSLNSRLSVINDVNAQLSARASELESTARNLRDEVTTSERNAGALIKEVQELLIQVVDAQRDWDEKKAAYDAAYKELVERKEREAEQRRVAEERARQALEEQERKERAEREERERKEQEDRERLKRERSKREQRAKEEQERKELEDRQRQERENREREEKERQEKEAQEQSRQKEVYNRLREQVLLKKQRDAVALAESIRERQRMEQSASHDALFPASVAVSSSQADKGSQSYVASSVSGEAQATHTSHLSNKLPSSSPPAIEPHPISKSKTQAHTAFVAASTEIGRRVVTDAPFSSLEFAFERNAKQSNYNRPITQVAENARSPLSPSQSGSGRVVNTPLYNTNPGAVTSDRPSSNAAALPSPPLSRSLHSQARMIEEPTTFHPPGTGPVLIKTERNSLPRGISAFQPANTSAQPAFSYLSSQSDALKTEEDEDLQLQFPTSPAQSQPELPAAATRASATLLVKSLETAPSRVSDVVPAGNDARQAPPALHSRASSGSNSTPLPRDDHTGLSALPASVRLRPTLPSSATTLSYSRPFTDKTDSRWRHPPSNAQVDAPHTFSRDARDFPDERNMSRRGEPRQPRRARPLIQRARVSDHYSPSPERQIRPRPASPDYQPRTVQRSMSREREPSLPRTTSGLPRSAFPLPDSPPLSPRVTKRKRPREASASDTEAYREPVRQRTPEWQASLSYNTDHIPTQPGRTPSPYSHNSEYQHPTASGEVYHHSSEPAVRGKWWRQANFSDRQPRKQLTRPNAYQYGPYSPEPLPSAVVQRTEARMEASSSNGQHPSARTFNSAPTQGYSPPYQQEYASAKRSFDGPAVDNDDRHVINLMLDSADSNIYERDYNPPSSTRELEFNKSLHARLTDPRPAGQQPVHGAHGGKPGKQPSSDRGRATRGRGRGRGGSPNSSSVRLDLMSRISAPAPSLRDRLA